METVDIVAGGLPRPDSYPQLDVIIPPTGGHGADIYKELGASNALVYSEELKMTQKIQISSPVMKYARIGIIENPQAFGSSALLSLDKAGAAYAMRLTGTGYSSATFTPDSIITQTTGTGLTAIGKVLGYDQVTGVFKILARSHNGRIYNCWCWNNNAHTWI